MQWIAPYRPTLVAILALALVAATPADARIRYMALQDLVDQSDLVFYGETVPDPNSPYVNKWVLWFKVKELVKKPLTLPDGILPVCDQMTYVDTVDVRNHPGAYVVFAKFKGHCYAPVAGYKSLIGVNEDAAYSAPIDGEPDTQLLSAFLEKLRRLSSPTQSQ